MPGPSNIVFLSRSRPLTTKEHRVSTSEEDLSYLANLTVEALKKELSNLAY